MQDEGSIKFRSHWIEDAPLPISSIYRLNQWRDRLYGLGLLGVNGDGVGYGNLSIRLPDGEFLITGSSTGRFPQLTGEHYTKVTAYSFEENSLTSRGPVQASSESLTHAMVYECMPEAQAVFHVHHLALWKLLLEVLPATDPAIPYGTPGMALEVARLAAESPLAANRIFAMGGHEEGIFSFGRDMEEAGKILLQHLEALKQG